MGFMFVYDFRCLGIVEGYRGSCMNKKLQRLRASKQRAVGRDMPDLTSERRSHDEFSCMARHFLRAILRLEL
jgi:hypothetical protein